MKTMITKAQEKKAAEARNLMKRLGFPLPQRLIIGLWGGTLTNADVTPEDVRRSAVWRNPSLPPTIKAALSTATVFEGHTDIMYLCNKQNTIFVTVYKPIDLVVTEILRGFANPNRSAWWRQLDVRSLRYTEMPMMAMELLFWTFRDQLSFQSLQAVMMASLMPRLEGSRRLSEPFCIHSCSSSISRWFVGQSSRRHFTRTISPPEMDTEECHHANLWPE